MGIEVKGTNQQWPVLTRPALAEFNLPGDTYESMRAPLLLMAGSAEFARNSLGMLYFSVLCSAFGYDSMSRRFFHVAWIYVVTNIVDVLMGESPLRWQFLLLPDVYFIVYIPILFYTAFLLAKLYRLTRQLVSTRCIKCHYMLRGLQSTRCPECGTFFWLENGAGYSRYG